MTSDRPERPSIASVPNLRDLGGWSTRDGGRIRAGVLYRSTELGRLDGDDVGAFAALGIRTVYDLRTAAEVTALPDRLPGDVTTVCLDVLADASHSAPAELREMFADADLAHQLLGEGQAERYFEQAYRDFVTLPSARSAFAQLFQGFADGPHPALFHCATGKDRTGWATAALLLLLGVPEEQVREEYLLTNTELLPALAHWMDAFRDNGGDPQLLVPILGVQASYLQAALEEMRTQFGSVEDYFRTGLGLPEATLDGLRDALVEPPDLSQAPQRV